MGQDIKVYLTYIQQQANTFVVDMILRLYLVSSLLFFITTFFFLHIRVEDALLQASMFLIFGFIPFLTRKFSDNQILISIAIYVSLIGLYLVVNFGPVSQSGLTLWGLIFILISISMMHLSAGMIVGLSCMTIGITVYYMIEQINVEVQITSGSYLARIWIIACLVYLAFEINKRYRQLFLRNLKHLIEIEDLNSELQASKAQVIEKQKALESVYEVADRNAYEDKLTGLPNRHMLYKNYPAQTTFVCTEHEMIAILLMDMDDFAEFNEIHGYEMGDKYIVKLVQDLQEALGTRRYELYRVSGDRFLLILFDLSSKDEIMDIMLAFKQLYMTNQDDLLFSLSVSATTGISFCPTDDVSLISLEHMAEIALTYGKQFHRGTYKFYSKEIMETFERRTHLEQALVNCIDNEEICAVFQPIHYGDSNKLMGFEALMRWNNAQFGHISPYEFIPYAEENLLIIDMGYWMLVKAASSIKHLNDKHSLNLSIHINVSAVQLLSPNFLNQLEQVIHVSGLAPELISLEITENRLIESLEVAIKIIEKIRLMGLKIALDDFGTGYASLHYLNRLPIDVVKIDRSFVTGIHEDDSRAVVEAMIRMFHGMDCEVVAEGVETEEQRAILKALGCNYLQGYLLSKPLDCDNLEAYVKAYVETYVETYVEAHVQESL